MELNKIVSLCMGTLIYPAEVMAMDEETANNLFEEFRKLREDTEKTNS